MAIPQFSGETPYDAVREYYGLDIEEEAEFLEFLDEAKIDPYAATLDILEQAVMDWNQAVHRRKKEYEEPA